MRTSSRRSKKYDKKIRGLVLPGQLSRFSSVIGRQVEIEKIVNTIVGSDLNRVYYIIFGKEVFKLIGKHKAGILDSEIDVLEDKWIARGLTENTLEEIEEAVGYIRPPVPVTNPFLLDSSLLDGTDVLG